MKKIISLIAVVLLSISLVGCQSSSNEKKEVVAKAPTSNPTAIIEMSNGKKIELELFYEKAPNTVSNFITLADSGFYNNLTFHRVIANFMIQGGDPKGTGVGGPDYSIKGEFSKNGFTKNDIKHERGVISMARSASRDSAGSQFFIMHGSSEQLNGEYAGFGKVTQGLEVVDAIATTPKDGKDKPLTAQTIKAITVDKKDGVYVVEKIAKNK